MFRFFLFDMRQMSVRMFGVFFSLYASLILYYY
nr:MAG TPA: hypothetical protein [Caudoviricetes sp.]